MAGHSPGALDASQSMALELEWRDTGGLRAGRCTELRATRPPRVTTRRTLRGTHLVPPLPGRRQHRRRPQVRPAAAAGWGTGPDPMGRLPATQPLNRGNGTYRVFSCSGYW